MFKNFKRNLFIILAVFGPGLITAFADNDAGGVATYSVSAAKYGYSMLTTLIPITLVLMITQEIGGRIAVVTGKGLADLIRERFGIKMSIFIFFLLCIVNFAVIIQNVGGLKAALQTFNLDYRIFLPIIIGILFFVITKASYSKIERFFLSLILFYLSYLLSAIIAKPDWALVTKSLVVPTQKPSFDYIYTSIAVLGTTVTAWGQFFINSFVKDKKLTPDKLKYNRLEIYIGAILTDIFSLFMMVAVIATIYIHQIQIKDAADAAIAIKPFAGNFASLMFGLGLLVAGFIGAAIVPLATAYAFSEFFGFEGSLDVSFSRSKLFYGIFMFQVLLAVFVVMIPQVNLFQITLYADFLNGIMLPIVFIFLYSFANNVELMGKYKNTSMQNLLLVGSGIVITLGSLAGLVGKIFGL